ncbi:hypothetical protein CAPTEDRAFT_224944 [Capitella teleta]|uniref:Uncharacterized protein n=1 Tax=Capitella teleta TaxID=283909 RepID=R7T733_CAPTE|nr:hypothetical protein CAPTEDRAFT_224944 [Capitella teleta]|eukprot:ELT87165.1 hypothetical protein CAPTEDRAFT_224944 [Capitella teleta]
MVIILKQVLSCEGSVEGLREEEGLEGRDSGLEDGEEEAEDHALHARFMPARSVISNRDVAEEHQPSVICAVSNPLLVMLGWRSLLASFGCQEGPILILPTQQRNAVVEAWNSLHDHDRIPSKFLSVYKAHWGNTLYGRTKGLDVVDAGVTQRLKIANCYNPAQPIDMATNRLVFGVIKHLWVGLREKGSPKDAILSAYTQIQQRVLLEDPVLSMLGVPLTKINAKCVRDFLSRQECLLARGATAPGAGLIRRLDSVSTAPLPDAPLLPQLLAEPLWTPATLEHTASRAGERPAHHRVMEPTACTSSWTRSTSYKWMKPDSAFALEAKVPLCTLCGHSTQGHKKHKKKTFCPVRQESSSKG